MALINVRTFVHKEGSFSELEEVTVDTTDLESMKELREANKKSSVLAVPVLEDGTLDLDGIEALTTPGRRAGTAWTQEMVARAHEMKDVDNFTDLKIQLELYSEFKVEVTADAVKKTLKQEANTEFDLEDGLRERVLAKTGTDARTRKKVDEEMRQDIVDSIAAGMSGTAVAKKHGISSSHANKIYREAHGYRRKY